MALKTRREFLHHSAAVLAGAALSTSLVGQEKQPDLGVRQDAGVEVLFPRGRVPLSFIIDDSTCLVNMGRFSMPQFEEAWPERDIYKKPWRTWPAEIPDGFVREFGEWCADRGVRGKYSLVPNPALVGYLDRELPGWSRQELRDSLNLVRELMLPSWDIHPEMITHTRAIDIATGRPFADINNGTMENSFPSEKKSADELAAYLAYALRILKNCDLPCEGITTPGGFGNACKSELSLAVQQAVRKVYGAEIPHYFKYVADGEESTEPKLEHVSGVGTADLRLTVNVPAGTGDWFGNWDGDAKPEGEHYANEYATAGRMVELIEAGRPAIMLCHWAGLYSNGTKEGFQHCQRVITALGDRFRHETIWMKVSEIARYWAAKELTEIRQDNGAVTLTAPFAAPNFTLRIDAREIAAPRLTVGEQVSPLQEVSARSELKPGAWLREKDAITLCFDLAKGTSTVNVV